MVFPDLHRFCGLEMRIRFFHFQRLKPTRYERLYRTEITAV